MRKFGMVALVLFASVAFAQDFAHDTFSRRPFEITPWVGGGLGLRQRTDWKFFNAGVRVGKVLTGEKGAGFFRGNFEFAADVIPLYMTYQPEAIAFPAAEDPSKVAYVLTGRRQRVYGYSFNPVVLTWNFTRGKRIVPFFSAEGGLLVTRKDVPFPDTSNVNFTPGGAFGAHVFLKNNHAITFSGHVTHVSNASLGDHNPGINAALLFRVGYSWFK
ncbi:MAG TPA: acyloxyacyl hydrolase [Terriglobales bacterium]|nr:acyloxyacyl hydrolase [Terriglobales bacterium]